VRTGFGGRPDLDGLPAVTGLGDAPTAGALDGLGAGLGEGLLEESFWEMPAPRVPDGTQPAPRYKEASSRTFRNP